MKKTIAVALILLVVLGISGCGKASKETVSNPTVAAVTSNPVGIVEESGTLEGTDSFVCPNGIYAYENALSLEFSKNNATLTIGTDFGVDEETVTKGTYVLDGNIVKCSFEDGTEDKYTWDKEKDTLTWMDYLVLKKTTKQIVSEKHSTLEGNLENIPDEDLSAVQTEWMLQDGYYVAGIDIPAGTFDVAATGGIGFISSPYNSANLRGAGYESFGDYYPTFKNFKLEKGDILEIKGVQISITYSKVTSTTTGRIYDETKSIELTPGNYLVGKDIPAGMYNVRYVSGDGGFVSSSRDEGDFIISSNMDGDSSTGEYVDFVSNILLVDGEEFEVTSGLVVSFIPEC